MFILLLLIAIVLQEGLAKNFSTVEVTVVDCPDLREKPWTLAAPGMQYFFSHSIVNINLWGQPYYQFDVWALISCLHFWIGDTFNTIEGFCEEIFTADHLILALTNPWNPT